MFAKLAISFSLFFLQFLDVVETLCLPLIYSDTGPFEGLQHFSFDF